jgi:hypothetical protein
LRRKGNSKRERLLKGRAHYLAYTEGCSDLKHGRRWLVLNVFLKQVFSSIVSLLITIFQVRFLFEINFRDNNLIGGHRLNLGEFQLFILSIFSKIFMGLEKILN